MKTWIIIIVTALVAGGVAFSMGIGASMGGAANIAAPVRIEPAAKGALTEFVTASGKIEPETKVSISARVAARIVSLPCEEGAEVVAGDNPTLLVKLDSKDLEAALESATARRDSQAAQIDVAQANLVANRADLKLKALELERNTQLLNSSDVSQQSVDKLQSEFERITAGIDADEKNLIVLNHNLKSAQAEITRAKDNLDYTSIYSPIKGVVTRLNSEVGELAMVGTTNTAGTTIMEVADLSRMLLKAQVDEADIGGIREGQKAHVRIQAYRDKLFPGVVTHIALTTAASTSQGGGQSQGSYFEVEILLDTGGERIYSGLTADADIEVAQYPDVIRVPSQAVLGRNIDDLPADIQKNEWIDKTKTIAPVVYRVVDGKAVVTPVKIGPSDGLYTVILGGLNADDPVVAGPYKFLQSMKHDQLVIDETKATPEQRKAYERAAGGFVQPESEGERRRRGD